MTNFSKVALVGVVGLLLSTSVLAKEKKGNKSYAPLGYNIETIATPKGVAFQIAGLDVNAKNEVYVATRFGEVWKYNNETWTKFAEGLHEPTGLMCDDDGSIVITQKPEMTRLRDNNNDGIADDYILMADSWEFHDNYHEYNFGPVKDKQGNYYGTLNLSHKLNGSLQIGAMGSGGGYRGWAYQVDKNGKFTPFASGLRSPAGIGSSPQGEIFYTDNQGDWVATSKLHLLEKNKFYGHPVSLVDHPAVGSAEAVRALDDSDFDAMREKPAVWFPHIEVANSPGNPEWDVSNGKFGPFKGQIFIGDQTQSNVFRVLLEKVNGKYQGAAINFINGFQSGNIRTAFDGKGQLWVGQTSRGWGSKGKKPFGLQKVVWDGTAPFELLNINLTKKGFKLSFTQPVDSVSAVVNSLKVQQWHYNYSRSYGSPKVDLKKIALKNVKLSNNGKELEITMPLTADKVVEIDFSGIKGQSGTKPSTTKVYYTLNELIK